MDLSRKMSRTEVKELSDEDKKERIRLRAKEYNIKYYQENKDKFSEYSRKYRENNIETLLEKSKKYYQNNKEYFKEYNQTPIGKKVHTLAYWKHSGLEETKEELNIIYELYLTQECCYSCDIKLTRGGDRCSTQACMDHDHITHRFRQICCRSCNNKDSWMKYWC